MLTDFEDFDRCLPKYRHEVDALGKQFLQDPSKGAIGDESNELFYIVRMGLPGHDYEMSESVNAGIGIVASSNVCATHCFLRTQGSRCFKDIALIFQRDFEYVHIPLFLRARFVHLRRILCGAVRQCFLAEPHFNLESQLQDARRKDLSVCHSRD